MFLHLKPTLKSTIISAIELFQDESIHNCDFQTGEVKAPGPAIFGSLNFHSNSMKFQRTNWLFECSNISNQNLKNSIVSAIESCSRNNQFTTVTFKLVKSKHQESAIFGSLKFHSTSMKFQRTNQLFGCSCISH
jgi:hypothetical protein